MATDFSKDKNANYNRYLKEQESDQDNGYTAEQLAAMEQKEKDAAAASTTPVTTDNVTPVTTTPEETDETEKTVNPYAEYVTDYINELKETIPEPQKATYDEPEPQRNTYVQGDDWWDTYFPVVSKEEEQQRQKRYEQVQRWSLFGNALAAIGNAVGATQGLKPVKIYEPKMPDLQTWKTQLNSDRAKRATLQQQQQQQYETAHRTWQTGKSAVEKQYTKDLNDYYKALMTGGLRAAALKGADDRAAENNATRTAIADKNNATKLAIENIKAQMKAAGKTGTSRTRGGKGSTSDSGVWDEALTWINSGKLSEEEVKSLQTCKSEKTARAIINKFNRFHKTNNTTATGSTGGNNTHKHSRLIH